MHSIGIDIGTTNITLVLFNDYKGIVDIVSKKNSSEIKGDFFESLQDASEILNIVEYLLDEIINKYQHMDIKGIGISNQMHGILYVNKNYEAISSFYNWQDKRGDELLADKSFVEYIKEKTSMEISTGYGLATHFYNQHFNLVPEQTYKMLDIGTYVGYKLVGKFSSSPLIHPSNAQSWGLYDTKENSFDYDAIGLLSIDINLLPQVSETNIPIGHLKNIPVYQPLGDNQAGFLGIVGEHENSILINIGTSAQLSCFHSTEIAELEKRPFINNKNIYVASSLCGGRTIELWVQFLKDTIKIFDSKNRADEDITKLIYEYISNIRTTKSNVRIFPYFYASRNNPSQKASIENLTAQNFNIEKITIGMIQGVVDELYTLWDKVPVDIRNTKKNIMLTGGGSKIGLFSQCVKEKFKNMNVTTSAKKEAVGAGAAQWVFYLQRR